jgi:hypothetical protein
MDSSQIQKRNVIKQMIPQNVKWMRLTHESIIGHNRLTVSSLLSNQHSSKRDESWRREETREEGMRGRDLYLP